jgi:hypothetical protein
MEPLWSPVVATGRNQWQMRRPRKRRKQAKTVATGCHPLPEKFHGKEGVSGSSPEEGSHESPVNAVLLLFRRTALRPTCLGMEQVLEQPDERGRDFVVWPGIRVGRGLRWGYGGHQHAERPRSSGLGPRLCKSEAAGSNPARSISRKIYLQDFPRLGFHHRQQRCERGASGQPDSCRAQSSEVELGACLP